MNNNDRTKFPTNYLRDANTLFQESGQWGDRLRTCMHPTHSHDRVRSAPGISDLLLILWWKNMRAIFRYPPQCRGPTRIAIAGRIYSRVCTPHAVMLELQLSQSTYVVAALVAGIGIGTQEGMGVGCRSEVLLRWLIIGPVELARSRGDYLLTRMRLVVITWLIVGCDNHSFAKPDGGAWGCLRFVNRFPIRSCSQANTCIIFSRTLPI